MCRNRRNEWGPYALPGCQYGDGRVRLRAFTLWELLCAITVIGVVLASAGPPLQSVILDSRRTAAVNALVTAVQLARAESAKRGAVVVLCPTRDHRECASDATAGDLQWMLIVPASFTPQPRLADTDQPLMLLPAFEGGVIQSNRAHYAFRPFRQRSTNGTITFCDRRGSPAARAIVVSYTGRPRATHEGPGGRDLHCPEFLR